MCGDSEWGTGNLETTGFTCVASTGPLPRVCEACRRVVKISGQEPQRAGFQSRSVATCDEALGRRLTSLGLPCPHLQDLHVSSSDRGRLVGLWWGSRTLQCAGHTAGSS